MIELLVSIVILSIVMLSFMAFFTNSFTYNTKTDDKIEATNLVREVQEELKVGNIYQDLNSFIFSVENNSENLQKSSYPNLNLAKNIEKDSITGTYKLTLKNDSFDIIINIDPNSNPETPTLYKFNIQALKNNKLLSQTYTYINF